MPVGVRVGGTRVPFREPLHNGADFSFGYTVLGISGSRVFFFAALKGFKKAPCALL